MCNQNPGQAKRPSFPIFDQRVAEKQTGKKVFTPYKVRLLKDFDGEEDGDAMYQAGQESTAQLTPNGVWHLIDQGTDFHSPAIEGIDFVFI